VSNILLRTYVERFGYKKCGDFKTFLGQYEKEIESYKIKYQRDSSPFSVLNINRDLRNYSVHSKPEYKFIKSPKKSIQILSEPVIRLTNNLGEKEIVLIHDLDNMEEKRLTYEETTLRNTSCYKRMVYGEFLIEEVLDCIRQIDLK